MGNALIDLLPLILASAVLPSWITVIILLLRSDRGPTKALALVGGMTTTRLLQGIFFGLIFQGLEDFGVKTEQKGVISLLYLIIGLTFAISAIRSLVKMDDFDDITPRWKSLMSRVGPVTVFGIGIIWLLVSLRLWIFTLSAIHIIRSAELSWFPSILLYLYFMLGAEVLLVIPIFVARIISKHPSPNITACLHWIETNKRQLMISVCALFSVFFFWKGFTGLLP
jgi:Sap, sulfolipid-1-addressing protein